MEKMIRWIIKNKDLSLFIVFLSVAVICFIIAIVYSSVINLELMPYPNGPLYTGLKAHLISPNYHLVKVLLPISLIAFATSIVFLIKEIRAVMKQIKASTNEVEERK